MYVFTLQSRSPCRLSRQGIDGRRIHAELEDSFSSFFVAVNMYLTAAKPTSVVFAHGPATEPFCVSSKRRGRSLVAMQRAISTDKTAERQEQTKNATGNITPFSNGAENDHPFLLVRQVTDMIIRNWVSNGGEQDVVVDTIQGTEEPECPTSYSEEDTQEMPVKNLKKREQVHAMLLDWDRFA